MTEQIKTTTYREYEIQQRGPSGRDFYVPRLLTSFLSITDAMAAIAKAPPVRPATTLTVELAGHGEFKTALATVEALDKLSKGVLAARIALCYDHGDPVRQGAEGAGIVGVARPSYWLYLPKSVLVIVLGGLTQPLN